ncbi:MAG TPA: AMP-binding protein [Acidimicrobiales bacterium]|nr:AMP-binding protein [Acidimicrobiales bacterium]
MKELVAGQVLVPVWERFATTVAFHDGQYHGDYAQHADRVLRLTDAMGSELGLSRGDPFAVLAVNSHEYLELYHAAFLGAGVINPLNLRLAPAELQTILADSEAEVIFVDEFFIDHLLRAIEPVRRDLPLRKVVLIGDGDHACDIGYSDLIELGHPNVPDEPDESDPVVLMYTGGTTGLPKGALLDQRAEMLNLYHIAMTVDLDPGRVYLHQIPMFHAASMGAILGIPAIGGISVFQPLFEPAQVMDLIEEYSVDWTTVVPTMLAMILDHPKFGPERFSSMRDLVYGASPMPPALLNRVRQQLPAVALWQGYGMTECSSVLTMLTDSDHRAGGQRLLSAGRPVLGVQVSVRDRGGNVLGPYLEGEVCARGGNFLREYWHRPKETEMAIHDGWYCTGDLGHVDEDGYLYLVDRSNDMIVSGGENVYSIEVENALSSHSAVSEVAVIGIPHETWGEQVHAVVVLRPGARASAEELQLHARRTIAGYKVPKSIEFRQGPLPLSGALKPLKRELRQAYIDRTTGQVKHP